MIGTAVEIELYINTIMNLETSIQNATSFFF